MEKIYYILVTKNKFEKINEKNDLSSVYFLQNKLKHETRKTRVRLGLKKEKVNLLNLKNLKNKNIKKECIRKD